MSKQSWGKRNHIDEGVELVGFSKLPSEREWKALMEQRDWFIKHQHMLSLIAERDRSIVELRFGIDEGPIHTLGAIAAVYELDPVTIGDIVSNAQGDLRRVIRLESGQEHLQG